ncbi:Organic cation transporter protein [Eumeta japonica]|uniref:Organic cation transporter protein n=1 Tax=Eumeta variegata TaxID=151549 RepID=A0A4C1YJD5_EUMVA|nr:Organic cation transporter protein [Eumeta japonica]
MEQTDKKNDRDRNQVDLDTILVQEVGQFGPYQLRTILLAAIIVIFMAWHAEYVFTAARTPTRCFIEECDSHEPVFEPGWLSVAIPPDGDGFDNCARYGNRTVLPEDFVPDDTCPADLFDTTVVQPCDRYVHGDTYSAVVDVSIADGNTICCTRSAGKRACEPRKYRWSAPLMISQPQRSHGCIIGLLGWNRISDRKGCGLMEEEELGLECDEWRRTLIGTVRTLGTIPVLPLTGYVSDRWGRRTALVLNGFNTAWLGLLRYWANTYAGFLVSQFVEAALGAGGFSSAYILATELVGPKYRVAAGATMSSFFALGQVLLGWIARAVPAWRTLTLVLYAPQLITLAYFWIIGESIRWLLSKGRYDHAADMLRTAATANGKRLSDEAAAKLRAAGERERFEAEKRKAELARAPWLPVLVLRSRPVLLRCAVSPFWWISMTFIYYGLSINSVDIAGDSYYNFMAVSAIEVPGYWTAVLLLDRIGRRPVLMVALWVCAACQFGYIFLPDSIFMGVSLTLLDWQVLHFDRGDVGVRVHGRVVSDHVPTQPIRLLLDDRSAGVHHGATDSCAQTIWSGLPFALFGACAFLSGCLILLTPETRGARLPDTMHEAEMLGKNTSSNSSQGENGIRS